MNIEKLTLKMRLSYVKRGILITSMCFGVWIVVSYMSLVEISPVRTRNWNSNDGDKSDLENRIDKLERELANEIFKNKGLLQRVKDHLKNVDDDILKNDGKDDEEPVNNVNQVEALPKGTILPILVMACNRVTVTRCLDNLLRYRPNAETFPIIISQDCDHQKTYELLEKYAKSDASISVVKQPDQSLIDIERSKQKFRGYYNIARHYRFALNHTFNNLGYEAVIIVEDDLDISPDFFEYFQGTYPLLLKDPSLWCVSAWNDNGKRGLVEMDKPEMLYRTDFFPGLGWMLRKHIWNELEAKWPPAFFDDWLRNPNQTKGRSCIRPEISRTTTFGKVGVSKGLFFDMHLKYIVLNQRPVFFTQINLSYLIKEHYDREYLVSVYDTPAMTIDQLQLSEQQREMEVQTSAVRIPYATPKQYKQAAKALGLMEDFRSGVARTAYKGVVSCFHNGRRIYIAPDPPIDKYDPSWA